MTLEKLREAVRSQPFRPFTVCLADGQRFLVRSPEYIWVPPETQRTFYVNESGERDRVIDLLLVTALDFVNGAPKRRRRSG